MNSSVESSLLSILFLNIYSRFLKPCSEFSNSLEKKKRRWIMGRILKKEFILFKEMRVEYCKFKEIIKRKNTYVRG